MTILICGACGYPAGSDYVGMVDACPCCKATPFVEFDSEPAPAHPTNVRASSFVTVLNESAVTFVPHLSDYGYAHIPGTDDSGYEAISPTGEIKAFDSYRAANEWRMSEVREFVSNGWVL